MKAPDGLVASLLFTRSPGNEVDQPYPGAVLIPDGTGGAKMAVTIDTPTPQYAHFISPTHMGQRVHCCPHAGQAWVAMQQAMGADRAGVATNA
jgi:hypothetical protein